MTYVCIEVLVVVALPFFSQAIFKKHFKENPYFRNKLFENSTQYFAESMSMCSSHCGQCCECFGFNVINKTCRVPVSCDPGVISGKEDGWIYFTEHVTDEFKTCSDLYMAGYCASGFYTIYPWDKEEPHYRPVEVYCDMKTNDEGWTAIQKRIAGSVDFNRIWEEYKIGFGIPQEGYWIGNDAINQLTKDRNLTLYLSITLMNNTRLYQIYESFSIADETNQYRLHLGGETHGTLGDSLVDTANTGKTNRNLPGMAFSTPDRDNDPSSSFNCALSFKGGWWFNRCYLAFLNGRWAPNVWQTPWYPTVMTESEVKETRMMIR